MRSFRFPLALAAALTPAACAMAAVDGFDRALASIQSALHRVAMCKLDEIQSSAPWTPRAGGC